MCLLPSLNSYWMDSSIHRLMHSFRVHCKQKQTHTWADFSFSAIMRSERFIFPIIYIPIWENCQSVGCGWRQQDFKLAMLLLLLLSNRWNSSEPVVLPYYFYSWQGGTSLHVKIRAGETHNFILIRPAFLLLLIASHWVGDLFVYECMCAREKGWWLINESSVCFCRTQINFTVAIDFTASNGETSEHTHTYTQTYTYTHTQRDTFKLPAEHLLRYTQQGNSNNPFHHTWQLKLSVV